LAGAVFAAAVILHPEQPIDGLADSKSISEKKRDELASKIKARAFAWAIASCSVEEIDRINILQASLLAMLRAVENLKSADGRLIVPEMLLVDGLHCPRTMIPSRAIVKGDSKEPSISAASILAKTARDDEMRTLDLSYPQYGFAKHKGYPTKAHLQCLAAHGVSAVHRRSYGPIKKLLDQIPVTGACV
jgi:ribonuclease HII